MQISYDAQLILLGAFIGGLFPLLGILLKDQLDARRRRIEREEEQIKLDETFRLDLIERGILNDPKVAVMRLPKREEER